jgi:hypothetical protein
MTLLTASWVDIESPPVRPTRRPHPGLDPCRQPVELQSLESRQFLAMERAFSVHGGMASGEEVARQLRQRCDQPISMLARWIVSRTVVSVAWRAETLLPMFQFDRRDMSLRVPVVQAIAELRDVFDDWELALWFVQPSAWLKDSSPVDFLAQDGAAILQAARADRFVARG